MKELVSTIKRLSGITDNLTFLAEYRLRVESPEYVNTDDDTPMNVSKEKLLAKINDCQEQLDAAKALAETLDK